MKQMARGAMVALALIGMSACVDDPQENINNDEFKTLQALPEVAFLKAGVDSAPVYFRLINDFGYGTPTHLTLKGVTGSIRVRQDTTFRSYYTNGDPNPSPEDSAAIPYLDGHLQRWWLYSNNVAGEGTFTLEASNGVETTVRVRVEPANLGNLPTLTATAGQNITLTAPAFTKFAQDAQVTYLRGATATAAGTSTSAGPVVARAADGTTLTFRAAPNDTGVIRVDKVIPTHAGLDPNFTPVLLATVDTLKVAPLPTNTVGASVKVAGVETSGPVDLGVPITISFGTLAGNSGTGPGTFKLPVQNNTRVLIGGREAGVVHTGTTASSAVIAADSSSITVLAPVPTPASIGAQVPITLTNVTPDYMLTGLAVVPTLTLDKTVAITGNLAAPNYLGTGTRATAPQLPIIGSFPTTALAARSIMINDNNPFVPFGTGDCVRINFPDDTSMSPATGKTIKGCKFYKLGLETTRQVETEVRWQTTNTNDMAVLSIYGTVRNPTATDTTIKSPNFVLLKRSGTAAVAGQAAAAAVPVTVVNGQYIALVYFTAGPPTFTSMRLTFR